MAAAASKGAALLCALIVALTADLAGGVGWTERGAEAERLESRIGEAARQSAARSEEPARRATATLCPASTFLVGPGERSVPPVCGQPCKEIQLTDLQACRYNVSDCEDGLLPGGVCEVRCRAPYMGKAIIAQCRGANLNVVEEPFWEEPECTLPFEHCEGLQPAELPDGYTALPSPRAYTCAEGYGGLSTTYCDTNEECKFVLGFKGCGPLKPCKVPRVDFCKVDMGECKGVAPGSSCLVHCKDPYFGSPAVAVCYPGDSGPDNSLLVVQPECILKCPDPVPPPDGYYKNATGHWNCELGYGGAAVGQCHLSEDCMSWLVLDGCSLLQPCRLPVHDTCQYDMNACFGLAPGRLCAVFCRAPYGTVTSSQALCPFDNTDPNGPLIWQKPKCELNCMSSSTVPVGYVSHPYVKAFESWECVSGYSGLVTEGCDTAGDCSLRLDLQGCEKVVRCAAPKLYGEDVCTYDVIDCLSVGSGESCNVGCRFPYMGNVEIATCPYMNVDPKQRLSYTNPECMISECPLPESGVPEGYRRIAAVPGVLPARYECADKYDGEAKWECIFEAKCTPKLQLSGCASLAPCTPPYMQECWMDFAVCAHGVYSGKECEIACRPPYYGSPGVGTCVTENTDPNQVMDVEPPSCNIDCVDPWNFTDNRPIMPEGYNKTAWQCANGFGGPTGVFTECAVDEVLCTPMTKFSGCIPLVPCHKPKLTPIETCMFDISTCESVAPGGSCEVKCAEGLKDKSGPLGAFCRANVVDPDEEILWIRPRCEAQCADPDPTPLGYVKTLSGCWVCAPGFNGHAQDECVVQVDNDCKFELILTGCDIQVSCRLPSLTSKQACMNNFTGCENLFSGEACDVTCALPYTMSPNGSAAKGRCPDGNTDTKMPLVWTQPQCDLACPLLWPLPEGYMCDPPNSKGPCLGYKCTPAYSGTAVPICETDENCTQSIILVGCKAIVPCIIPDQDLCQVDITLLGGGNGLLMPGVAGEPFCKAPYAPKLWAPTGAAYCPPDNTDPLGIMWQAPSCLLGCAALGGVQLGYAQVSSLMYECAAGYFGSSISRVCILNDGLDLIGNTPVTQKCEAKFVLTGCTLLQNCAPLEIKGEDACMYDVSACAVVSSYANGPHNCATKCRYPFFGRPTTALCPMRNTNTSRPPTWTEAMRPTCDCPNPNPWKHGMVPFEFVQSDSNFMKTKQLLIVLAVAEDTSGLSGYLDMVIKIRRIYEMQANLVGKPALSDPDLWHATMRNVSAELVDLQLLWTDFAVPEPIAWPFGFHLECSEGHVGTVVEQCQATAMKDACTDIYKEITGCLILSSCAPPVLDVDKACMYDIADCIVGDGLPGKINVGGTCDIMCKPPYDSDFGVENNFSLQCPPDNVVPDLPLLTDHVACKLNCLEPNTTEALLAGYRKGIWICAEGYAGVVQESCGFLNASMDFEGNCSDDMILDGCLPLVPCRPIAVSALHDCMYDVEDCLEVMPGRFCEVKCDFERAMGASTFALCPPDNTDPYRELVFIWPECVPLNCPAPIALPPIPQSAYVYTQMCDWQCSNGYAGSPETYCEFDSVAFENTVKCTPITYAVGCELQQPCIGLQPADYDGCLYDVSRCTDGAADPGYNCEIRCKDPWIGKKSIASCPRGNAKRWRKLEWVQQTCTTDCPEPPEDPEGYKSTSHRRRGEDTSYECAEGYFGNPEKRCVADPEADCQTNFTLSGCVPWVPCAPPIVNECVMDPSPCKAVWPGFDCKLACREPLHIGTPVTAYCPQGNTDPTTPLVIPGGGPKCSLDCPDPVFANPAYVRNESAEGYEIDYLCAPGALGDAVASCAVDYGVCTAELVLTGCALTHSCVMPEEGACRLNATDCEVLAPGTSCEGTCNSQFEGGNFSASCSFSNQEENTPITWVGWPVCKCRDPIWTPKGYVKTYVTPDVSRIGPYPFDDEWECAFNFSGVPRVECMCDGELSFSGCLPETSCAPPDPAYLVNSSSCIDVLAGYSCTAPCLSVGCIAGGPVEFRCPAKNTDRNTPLVKQDGQCRVNCEVCKAVFPMDLDKLEGKLTGVISFGPAAAAGSVSLPEVTHYRVVLEDSCGRELAQIGPKMKTVSYDPGCCREDLYNMPMVNYTLPEGADHFAIKVITMYGELPYGKPVPFSDGSRSAGVALIQDSAGWRQGPGRHMLGRLLVVAAMLSLSAP